MNAEELRESIYGLREDGAHVACIECAQWVGERCEADFHPSEIRERVRLCGRYRPARVRAAETAA